MRVLVIGATGRTGRLLIQQLLERGDTVAAFARTPSAIVEKNDRLQVIQGDARDAASVDRAVQGQEAVLVAIGARSLGKSDIQELLFRHLVAAMKSHGVKRVVNLGAWGVGQTHFAANLPLKFFRATFLRNVFADKERGESILLASGLDFINVSPGRLTDQPARGGVRTSADGCGLKPVMTRADLATFMIAQLTNDTWLHKAVIIGY